jgi:hypothetical protein
MANANGWGDGASNNTIGWGQGANNAIGWGDIHADSWAGLTDIVGITTPPVDPDAQAFITAAAITDPTQQGAINTLVVDLKGYSIWTKFKAIYPIVGGIASAHAVNLKTPGTYNLTFATGWTHSANGMTPLNTYADTSLIPNSVLSANSEHCSVYLRTNINAAQCDIGTANNTTQSNIFPNLSGTFYPRIQALNGGVAVNLNTAAFFIANRVASNEVQGWRNTTKYTISNNSTGLSTFPYWLAELNNNGSSGNVTSTRQQAFATIGDGLTDTDVTNLYTAIQAYQTALSRNV